MMFCCKNYNYLQVAATVSLAEVSEMEAGRRNMMRSGCKVLPFLPQLRAEYSPFQFQNAEWMTKKTKAYQARMPLVLERVRKMGSPLPETTKPEKTKLKKALKKKS